MMISVKNDTSGELLDTRDASLFLFGNDKRGNFYRLYRMRDEGLLKTKQIGKRFYYFRKELEEFVSQENAS